MTAMQLPKRIILSRKGVDSSAGGFPSLICDGQLLNIPIPEDHFLHDLTYGQLPLPSGPWEVFNTFGALVDQLAHGRIHAATPVHLDPDVRPHLHPAGRQCRPALGQCCSFDAELEPVEKGDLFLFFGWFAESTIANNIIRVSTRHEGDGSKRTSRFAVWRRRATPLTLMSIIDVPVRLILAVAILCIQLWAG